MVRAAKVSVVIPTYNRVDLLPRAIDSVFAQNYSNIEVIIVNDGSTDETQQVLDQYDDERLQCIHFEQNQGIGAARAAGVSVARGKWIAFLDADDIWLPGKLLTEIEILERYPDIDVLFGNYRNINYLEGGEDSGFHQTREAFKSLQTELLNNGVKRIRANLPEALLTANLIGTASILIVRRETFIRAGNFDSTLSGPEDFEWLWRAALTGINFAYHDKVLVERHKDSGSITARTLIFAPRLLKALEICEKSLYCFNRNDLLPLLNRVRLQTWTSLIHACAIEGDRIQALNAFGNSIHYGFAPQAILYLIAALAGPRAIALAKRLKNDSKSFFQDGNA